MIKNIYRIRLISADEDVWKYYQNSRERMYKKRKELWLKHKEIIKVYDYDESKITPLFQQMEINDRKFFEVQEGPEKIDLNDLKTVFSKKNIQILFPDETFVA